MPFFNLARSGNGPGPIVIPTPKTTVKTIRLVYTYAELVAAASGASQLPAVPAIAGFTAIPLSHVTRMQRNAIAGTSTALSFRFTGLPATNLMGVNILPNFASGGTDQYSMALLTVAGTTLTLTAGVSAAGRGITINNNTATLATGCVGTVTIQLTYFLVPSP